MSNWNIQNVSEQQWEDEESQVLSAIDDEQTEYEELSVLLCQYICPYVCKEQRKTSAHTGHGWVQEILATHGSRCHEMFRVEKHVFYNLCNKLVEHGLRNSRTVGVEEIVAMFLLTVGHGVGNRVVQELFQHSGETVSRLMHMVLEACVSLARENIKPCDPEFRGCHTKISNDRRYYPYFKDAIVAIDGTHIKCVVNRPTRDKYIGRKGFPTQNVMAVYDWDMCFTFVLAGWEGTAHDARVFHAATSNPSMNFPHPLQGKYYLVDVGYPTSVGYLGPYRCEHYHLAEFRRQHGFGNHKEVFNFYHSSLRSTIERTFGVWKNMFEILQKMRKYSYQTQVQMVCATMAIHNFIRRNGSHVFASSSTQMNHIRDIIRDQIVRDM